MQKNDYPYQISIIIVNYNVVYFLEQCLNSVKQALTNVSGEVFVVDNNSIDGSVDMVSEKFPEYQLISNKENVGFSKANNQAIQISKGKYILLLNPDTVVEEDTFEKVIQFMDDHPDAGGLGVRMLDGKGKFLPESKRGLPTPTVAFYKIFGLSKLFPRSKRFGQYHLGHLSEFETNEIAILSGAFMLMRHETIQQVGMLDEAFFMYGEDIDLSYRITKGGYKNYYFPETRIIHYKGESTKKSSVNYVFVFYRAMVIFATKHYSSKNAKAFSFLINLAIYLRAGMAVLARFIKKMALPFFDFLCLLGGLFALTHRWELNYIDFPQHIINIAIPAYTFTWLMALFLNNAYQRPMKIKSLFVGLFWGTAFILAIYALLPKAYQFSRLFILVGAAYTFIYFLISRLFLHFAFGNSFRIFKDKAKRFALVGSKKEYDRVSNIIQQTISNIELILAVDPNEIKTEYSVGTISQLDQIVHIHKIDEIIFCAKDIEANQIIHWMSKIQSPDKDFKIAQPDSMFIIGSNSIDTAGDLYLVNINAISKPENIRMKRTFDICFSILSLLLSPILIWFVTNKKSFLKNSLDILKNKKSFVGYIQSVDLSKLPAIKIGVLDVGISQIKLNGEQKSKLNLIYARDYTVKKDIRILVKKWKNMGDVH